MNVTFTITAILLSILLLVLLTIKVKLHPFFALTISAFFFGIISGHSIPDIIGAYSDGLGGTIAGIGVVIAIGTVMGSLLENSGAAETMAETILKNYWKEKCRYRFSCYGLFCFYSCFL